jgi:uncharacterized membrane protein YfcA
MTLTSPWWHWALAFAGAFIAGMSKTGIPGLGILAVPLFAFFLPARESVGIVLLVLICADVLAVLTYRREADWKKILQLAPWALAGIVIGTFALSRLNDQAVKQLIGASILPMVALSIRRRRMTAAGVAEKPLPAWSAGFVGLVAGFTTMVANAAGPVMNLYLIAMRLPKLTFLGTSAWYFFCLNWVKVPFGIYGGTITLHSAGQSAMLFPAAIAGGFVGRKIAQKIDQGRFEALALTFAALSGIWFLIGKSVLSAFR